MDQFLQFLASRWFGGCVLGLALLLGIWLLVARRRHGTWSLALMFFGSAVTLAGVGGLAIPSFWALVVGILAVTALVLMLVVLITTGRWSFALASVLGGCLMLGIGGLVTEAAGASLTELARVLLSLEAVQPWWLLLLGLVPVVVWLSFRSLAGLGPVRRWIAIGLRSTLIVLLTLALAEIRLRSPNDTMTVLFLVDRSLSIPQEFDPKAAPDSVQARLDHRWERIKQFVNASVKHRGDSHRRDRIGLIAFGRRPRLELPPSNVDELNFIDVAGNIDTNYTDIAAAMKLALASFPEGTAKRIVLISDGNENLGNAEDQARVAKHNGVQIDVVPLATGHKNDNEVMVARVEAPQMAEQGARLPIRVLVRSHNPGVVLGTLAVYETALDDRTGEQRRQLVEISSIQSGILKAGPPPRVRLFPGLNAFAFKARAGQQPQSYTYEAIFTPEGLVKPDGEQVVGLVGDRVQNNRATTHVVALGRRRILVIQPKTGRGEDEHGRLISYLKGRKQGGTRESKFEVISITPDDLPQNKAELAVFLSNYDCVILANVASSDVTEEGVKENRLSGVITEEQQEIIRSNTHDQGCGLVMIGGPNAFGAGGWQGTPVEKALPVDCEIKSIKIQGKGGLVLVMHASEMADGNRWQKDIAKLAIKKLSPMDMLGVLDYDWNVKWHIPFGEIGQKRDRLLRDVDRMTPGDMPDFDPALQKAYDALVAQPDLAKRHVIVISDGDPQQNNKNLLQKMKAAGITCTTVGVATHGAPQDQLMSSIALATGGRFYNVKSAKALPEIYTKETRLVSQSFVHERRFQPILLLKSGPTDGLPDKLEPLYGFVRTTLKQSPLVEMAIEGPSTGEQRFPILATWTYGLGKAVAFTSDARSLEDRPAWDRDWAASEWYLKFWEQVVDWSLRATEKGELVMTTEYKDGKVKVIVDARDPKDKTKMLSGLQMKGRVTPPSGKVDEAGKLDLKFEEKNTGIYEAEFKAEEAGSYFVRAQAENDGRLLGVRSGETVPYSPEFADMEPNVALLEKLREMTDGQTYAEQDLEKLRLAAAQNDALAHTSQARTLAGEVFRGGLAGVKSQQPIWFWLVLLTGTFLFFDVAVRRIALEPLEVSAVAERVWDRLRGRATAAEQTPQFLDRLRSRKAQVGEALDRERATRRFDADQEAPPAPAGAHEATAAPPPRPAPRRAPPPKIAAESEGEKADYASRLLKAKKKIWEERDKK